MSTDAEEIVARLAERRANRGPQIEAMKVMSRHYNNEIVIPLPEIDERETPAVANLIGQGIDQHGMRIASLPATIECPPVRPGVPASVERAKKRRLSAYGWLESNNYDLIMGKRGRHFVAYANSPVIIRPNNKTRQPTWEVKSPLDTYPAPTLNLLDMEPSDAIFTFQRTWAWIKRKYPAAATGLTASLRQADIPRDETLLECMEFVDDTEFVLLVIGKGGLTTGWRHEAEYGIGGAEIRALSSSTAGKGQWVMTLERYPNLIGKCPVVAPGRISLDNAKGVFDDTIGLFMGEAKMKALEVNMVARAIYPDVYFVKNSNGAGQIVRTADGMRGIIGEAEDGTFTQVQMQPGYQTPQIIAGYERDIRQNAFLPSEYGGESGTNIRTNARGNSVLSAQVDFMIDESQRLLARSQKCELATAALIDMAHYGNEKKSFYVSYGKSPAQLDYVPNEVWTESQAILVSYNYPGMDSNAATVQIGQELGLGLISKQTGMERSPHVKDPVREQNRIDIELLRTAMFTGLAQQAATGALPPADLARMIELLGPATLSPEAVVVQVQKEAQQRQATSGAPGTPEAPVAPGSPEAQPGIAQPGAGAEAGAVNAPPGDLDNLRGLLTDLKSGTALRGAAYNGAA